jgi:transcriptional regulator with XRE-family HTH domain
MTSQLPGPRERARTLRTLRERYGRQVADARTDAGATRAALARCAGLDPGHIWRIEAGTVSPSLEAMVAISSCLGMELGVRMFPVAGPRLHDRFQAPMVEALARFLGEAWRPQPEVVVPGARGVIDLVLNRSLDQLSVACECHSELRRLEAVVRRIAEKEEGLRGQVGPTSNVSSLLLLRSTRSTRAIATTYEATLAAAFPARTTDMLDALRGTGAWPGRGLVWASVVGGKALILPGVPRGVRVGR